MLSARRAMLNMKLILYNDEVISAFNIIHAQTSHYMMVNEKPYVESVRATLVPIHMIKEIIDDAKYEEREND